MNLLVIFAIGIVNQKDCGPCKMSVPEAMVFMVTKYMHYLLLFSFVVV